ncbi:hypothetical protein T459_13676 [Capsicum annuum]|uniref:Uncharacterized protein n=1 Tax=Capsicum annuum TaxID=4072 RepID=A0A2G2ZFG5_CAPAN|nr:hypothetical protein T459_13676 [Capsicum annuum]
MRKKVKKKHVLSLRDPKVDTHSILWVHRIKRKAALSWQSFRWQETLGLVGAFERNKLKPKMDQGSFPAKMIGEGMKDGTCKVRIPNVYYLVLEANSHNVTLRVSLPAQEAKHSARRPGLGAPFAFGNSVDLHK